MGYRQVGFLTDVCKLGNEKLCFLPGDAVGILDFSCLLVSSIEPEQPPFQELGSWVAAPKGIDIEFTITCENEDGSYLELS